METSTDTNSEMKKCGHSCSKSLVLRNCCSCMDTRPFAKSYVQYVDGIGLKMNAKRYDYYCPICHEECKQNMRTQTYNLRRPKRRV